MIQQATCASCHLCCHTIFLFHFMLLNAAPVAKQSTKGNYSVMVLPDAPGMSE